jgi:LysM repeat protein
MRLAEFLVMRSRPCSIGASALILSGLAAVLAGCSSGGSQDSFTTSNLGPRPDQGMSRDAPRYYPDGSSSGRGYTNGSYSDGNYGRPYAQAPRQYVDPGQQTPRRVAAAPYYGNQPGYEQPNIQTGSLGASSQAPSDAYSPNARWQQTPPSRWQQPAPAATTGPAPRNTTAAHTPHSPQIVEVREGDTLYGISRRHNVPVGDLVAANRLPNERIAIGQRLVIPTRIR